MRRWWWTASVLASGAFVLACDAVLGHLEEAADASCSPGCVDATLDRGSGSGSGASSGSGSVTSTFRTSTASLSTASSTLPSTTTSTSSTMGSLPSGASCSRADQCFGQCCIKCDSAGEDQPDSPLVSKCVPGGPAACDTLGGANSLWSRPCAAPIDCAGSTMTQYCCDYGPDAGPMVCQLHADCLGKQYCGTRGGTPVYCGKADHTACCAVHLGDYQCVAADAGACPDAS